MTGVRHLTITSDDDGMRLDRWVRQHCPGLGQARLEKLLRTGQVRLDGKRARSSSRLAPGQVVRLPPLPDEPQRDETRESGPGLSATEATLAADLRQRVLYRDAAVLVLNKPAGLAVQGGQGTHVHIDGLLTALRFGAEEPPRLVHRLDRDTSGVLVLARTRSAARSLTAAFRAKETRKLYWAAVAGQPKPSQGRIDRALAKRRTGGGERMMTSDEDGDRAVTLYRTIDRAHRAAAWLALMPLTGRTHQLRAHCAALGAPILGDGKYGGKDAFLPGAEIARKVHLHARRIVLPHPIAGHAPIDVLADLPQHMRDTWAALGFDPTDPIATDLF